MSKESFVSKEGWRYGGPAFKTPRRNATSIQVSEYVGRECRLEIVIQAKTSRRIEEPADTPIVDVRTEYKTSEFLWSDFKNLSGVKELLGSEWEKIEQEDWLLHQTETTLNQGSTWHLSAGWHYLFPCFSA